MTVPSYYVPQYTYNPANLNDPVSLVRRIIDDTDLSVTAGGRADRTVFYSDQEIQGFINDAPVHDPMYAAIAALRSMAMSIALMSGGNMAIGDFKIDQTSSSKALLTQADQLEKFIESIPAWEYAEINWNDPSYRRLLINQSITPPQ